MNTERDAAKQKLMGTVTSLVTALVDVETEVKVTEGSVNTLLLFEVRVGQGDFGKLIGRKGANARALRTLVRAMGRKYNLNAYVEVVDPQGNAYRIPDPEAEGEEASTPRRITPKPTR